MAVEDQLRRFLRTGPTVGGGVFIARGAVVVGDVSLGDHSSVWFNAVLRGDINRIVIGHSSNIQDNCIVHLADDFPCLVGNEVTVGHGAILHACTIGDGALIGMGAVVLDGAVIGEESIIGARALVTQGTRIPPGSLVLGSPAKVTRTLTTEERRRARSFAGKYVSVARFYIEHQIGLGSPLTA